MMNRKRFLFLAVTLFSSFSAWSYDDKKTHPFMTTKSEDIVANNYTKSAYSELFTYAAKIEKGTSEEDNPPARGVLHFFNPNSFFTVTEGLHGIFPSALSLAESTWTNALKAYYGVGLFNSAPNKETAYENLGRVLHLAVQDMSQPGHVHNDPHELTAIQAPLRISEK
jgi:hypothetical protein